MTQRSKYRGLKCAVAFNTQVISSDTTTNGNIIDTQGYSSLLIAIQSGTITTGTITPVLEHGDAANLSDAADVADANLNPLENTAVFAATDDNVIKVLTYLGSKRYVRLKLTTASTASLTVGATAILESDLLPVAGN